MSEPINPDDQRPSEPTSNPYGVPSAGEPQPGAYGTPPPPASAYPPAGPGGYQAGTPAPGYGPQDGFPPPPPVSGYGAVPPAADPNDIGQSLGWAWRKFSENAGALIVSHLLWGLGIGVVVWIIALVAVLPSMTINTSTDAGFAAAGSLGIGMTIVLGIATFVLASLAQIGLINGYLAITDGRKVAIGDFFKFRNVGQALILGLIVGVAAGLVSFTYIGYYVVLFFTIYAMFFVIDRSQSFQDALKNSAQLALKFVVPTILILLIVGLVAPLGAIVCFIGLLVTMPWAYLALTYQYRRLTGGYVAP
ncbi:putative membrane protein [Salana multivorans]|uniref:Putative membrane protein n=1 Tax=Salana multivorans TaxID=120377 RepID=A0A3N2D0C8_9MICO|nr:hypothetical protein [Salana multivorans]ROR93232.1 putative membrane protein [Salana multivorans]